jgi:hypothetical protein
MTEPTIYLRSKNYNINEALKILTDEWVDDGNYCAQTVIDLRDVLKYYIKECKKLEHEKDEAVVASFNLHMDGSPKQKAAIVALEDELDKFREAVKSSHDVLLTVVNECNLFYKESADIDSYTVSDCHSVLDKIKQLRY